MRSLRDIIIRINVLIFISASPLVAVHEEKSAELGEVNKTIGNGNNDKRVSLKIEEGPGPKGYSLNLDLLTPPRSDSGSRESTSRESGSSPKVGQNTIITKLNRLTRRGSRSDSSEKARANDQDPGNKCIIEKNNNDTLTFKFKSDKEKALKITVSMSEEYKLGGGVQGIVYKTLQPADIALKFASYPKPQYADTTHADFENEYRILRILGELKAYYYEADGEMENHYLFKDLVEGDALFSWLYIKHDTEFERRKPLNKKIAWDIIINLSKAVLYLHSKQIIHRDIKPENIIVNEMGGARLVDFGRSCLASEGTRDFVGTPGYKGPERTEGDIMPETFGSDLWGLGVTGFETLDQIKANWRMFVEEKKRGEVVFKTKHLKEVFTEAFLAIESINAQEAELGDLEKKWRAAKTQVDRDKLRPEIERIETFLSRAHILILRFLRDCTSDKLCDRPDFFQREKRIKQIEAALMKDNKSSNQIIVPIQNIMSSSVSGL